MTAGFPTVKDSVEILLSMQQGGVDVIELGVPFSDPLADGKMIQYANQVALTKEQMSVAKCFELLRAARAKGLKVPVVFMGYANPLFSFGLDNFLQHSIEAQVDGLILVDLPPEESQDWITKCSDNGISFVPLISPTSTEERIEKLCSFNSDGFIYVISSMGVTGQRDQVNQHLPELVQKVRKYSKIPIAVGFGVSNREQFLKVSELADGVVMGSAFIKVVKDAHGKESIATKVTEFSRSICGRNEPDFPPEDFKVQFESKNDLKKNISSTSNEDFHFGEFGGRYAPETLMYALQELEKSFQSVVKDETFWQEFKKYYPFVNRPSTLQYAANLTKHCNGARIWLKREDLNHTGSHKINNALGQALLARRLGKTNIIAETGAGQHVSFFWFLYFTSQFLFF
jgi:tryptophan synthase